MKSKGAQHEVLGRPSRVDGLKVAQDVRPG